MLWNTFFWTFERATWQYNLMVIAILAFVWLTPPGWIGDPMAYGKGPIGWLLDAEVQLPTQQPRLPKHAQN